MSGWLEALRDNTKAGCGRRQADSSEVRAFATKHTSELWPSMRTPVINAVRAEQSATRNVTRDKLCQAAREARAGCYSFSGAVDQIRAAAAQSYARRGRTLDEPDFDALVGYAVAQALGEPIPELRRRVARANGFASPTTLRLAERALAPGGRWHPDTPREQRYRLVDTSPPDAGTRPSWLPVHIRNARLGQSAAPPSILARADGACLFYRRKQHSVHGESESGKSWLVQCAAAEVLCAGEPVLYIDFEDDAGPVAERLIRLGVPEALVDNPAMFTYIRPDASPYTTVELAAFKELLAQHYTLVIIDGVTNAMGLFGLSGKDNDDIAAWQRKLPRALAHSTGAAVVCVDHVSKDADTRGRFALGGQHKMAGLDGAAFVVEMAQPFAVGMAGTATVRVGKDRPGHIRSLGGRWRKRDRTQLVATLRLDSTDAERTVWSLEVPGADTDDTDQGEAATFRPTWCMEKVSAYWEATDDLAQRSTTKTEKALADEQRDNGRQIGRDTWRAAIAQLVAEGFATVEPGPRKSHLHTVVRPYRQADDPQSDRYVEPADEPKKIRVRRTRADADGAQE